MSSFTLPVGYGLVLMEAAIMGLQCFDAGFRAFFVRQRVFTKSFMDTHFPSIKPPPELGYPDMGQGRFSDKLSERDWLELNNAQRAHYNNLEHLPIALSLLCISGLVYPRVAIVGGALFIAGRAGYGAGYRAKGPTGRYPWVLLVDLGLLALFGGSVAAAWSVGGGWSGMQKALQSFTRL